MTLAALSLCFAAFALLCVGLPRHYAVLYGSERAAPRRLRGLRASGWALLALAFAAAVAAEGWNRGPLLWLGGLTVAGTALALGLLPYRPRALAPAVALSLLLALAGWGWHAAA